MKKQLILICVFFLSIASLSFSQECFTIYLVRHAEKEVSEQHPKDPDLTACGIERAEHLSGFLTSIEIEGVYSTNYRRTRNTASPTANDKSLELMYYDPRSLEEFSKVLLEKAQNVLVIGHSNTTPVLAGLLSGTSTTPFPMSESDYNRIYQVVVCGESKQLNLFYTSFMCED